MFNVEKFLPFNRRYVTIDGYRMHLVDHGTGPVVMMLHGNPTWCFYFRSLIARLSKSYRVIAPDFIGCGLSDHPPHAHFRASHRMNHLSQLVEQLGIDRLSLVMHDWGGPIGTGFAVRHAEMIEKIVYLNTTITETESLPLIIKASASPIIGRFLTQTTTRFLKVTTEFGVCKKLSPEIKEGYFFPYENSPRRTAIWDFVQDIPFSPSHPSYSDMLEIAERIPLLSHVPVHIIWGMRDPCFHREMLSKVVAHYPHASVQEVKDASHLILEDAPELVGESIERFFEKGASDSRPRNEGASEIAHPHPLYAGMVAHARDHGEQNAVIVPTGFGDFLSYSHTPFRTFLSLVRKYERGLKELGLVEGDKVVMLVSPGVDFLALSYAVMGRGGIPVFLDPGMGRENLISCIKHVQPAVMIGSMKAQLLRLISRDLFRGLKFHLAAVDLPIPGTNTLSFLKRFSPIPLPAPQHAPQPVMIAFTSGATGTPKGVMFTAEMIATTLKILRESFGLTPGKRDLPLLPAFSLFHCALGITSVFPPVDPSAPLSLDPARVIRIIDDLQVDYSFGSPTLWKKIGEYCVRTNHRLGSLEKVFMAGAPVPEKTLSMVESIAPHATAYTPYGATEALPVTLVSAKELGEADRKAALSGDIGTFVGAPVHGVEVRIIEPVDDVIDSMSQTRALPPLEIGEILVRGGNVSAEYLGLPAATAKAKIKDGSTLWHRMGDMGYLDARGNLYFCGRKVHSVRTPDRVLYSDPVERIFNQHPHIRRSALIAVRRGGEPAVAVEPLPQYFPTERSAREAFESELRSLAATDPLTSRIERFFFYESFPVDARHNAKIFRERLGTWADEELSKGASQ